jgi:hypothetical protein
MQSLKFHTSHRSSPGHTSLLLDISYTGGLLNEETIRSAIQLAVDNTVSSISESFLGYNSQDRRQRTNKECSEGNQMDQILKQILCQNSNLSTV